MNCVFLVLIVMVIGLYCLFVMVILICGILVVLVIKVEENSAVMFNCNVLWWKLMVMMRLFF